MSERLDSAFATASDLVSPDDLETVLARIVERAASAVRAPGFVLAVRPESGGERHVFSDGVAPEEAKRIGGPVLDSDVHEGTMLWGGIASRPRGPGRAVGPPPPGVSFF